MFKRRKSRILPHIAIGHDAYIKRRYRDLAICISVDIAENRGLFCHYTPWLEYRMEKSNFPDHLRKKSTLIVKDSQGKHVGRSGAVCNTLVYYNPILTTGHDIHTEKLPNQVPPLHKDNCYRIELQNGSSDCLISTNIHSKEDSTKELDIPLERTEQLPNQATPLHNKKELRNESNNNHILISTNNTYKEGNRTEHGLQQTPDPAAAEKYEELSSDSHTQETSVDDPCPQLQDDGGSGGPNGPKLKSHAGGTEIGSATRNAWEDPVVVIVYGKTSQKNCDGGNGNKDDSKISGAGSRLRRTARVKPASHDHSEKNESVVKSKLCIIL